jgi:hypothetical protein
MKGFFALFLSILGGLNECFKFVYVQWRFHSPSVGRLQTNNDSKNLFEFRMR